MHLDLAFKMHSATRLAITAKIISELAYDFKILLFHCIVQLDLAFKMHSATRLAIAAKIISELAYDFKMLLF